MEVNETGLSKKARGVINEVDIFIAYYKKAKGGLPELIHLDSDDFESISKGKNKGAEKLTRNGVLLCRK